MKEHKDILKEILRDPDVRKEYDKLEDKYKEIEIKIKKKLKKRY